MYRETIILVSYHIFEEKFPISWDAPLWKGQGIIKTAWFISNAPIYPDRHCANLVLRNEFNDYLGSVEIGKKISAYEATEFEFSATKIDGILVLSKRFVEGRILALPKSLIQVEIE